MNTIELHCRCFVTHLLLLWMEIAKKTPSIWRTAFWTNYTSMLRHLWWHRKPWQSPFSIGSKSRKRRLQIDGAHLVFLNIEINFVVEVFIGMTSTLSNKGHEGHIKMDKFSDWHWGGIMFLWLAPVICIIYNNVQKSGKMSHHSWTLKNFDKENKSFFLLIVLNSFEWFWMILYRFESVSIILYRFESFWISLYNFESLRIALNYFQSVWISLNQFESFWISLNQFESV